MLLAGILLLGAGHGWGAGATGCFALSPISFFACNNALSPKPSQCVALAVLLCGLAVCLLVAARTISDGTEYFYQFFRVNGILGVSVAACAFLGWLLPSSLALLRARSTSRLGT
jgi:hypothetical protein